MAAQGRRPIWKRPAAFAVAVIPLVIAVVVAVLASVSETPRLDVSTDATLRASLARMTARMSDVQRSEFYKDCIDLTLSDMTKSTLTLTFLRDQAPSGNGRKSFKPLGGMSAAEIHRKADELRLAIRKAGDASAASTAAEPLPGVPPPFVVSADPLNLPPRPPSAPNGSAFARSIADLPLEKREEKIVAEVMAGNVPPFLRKLAPVSVSVGESRAVYFVTPDYLAVGSDDDFFLTPLTPRSAQVIADRLDCVLPTTKMVDDIYASAAIKLTPAPIPPSPAMTTVAVFLRHNEIVAAERKPRTGGELVAGHKKDVVITNKAIADGGKVAIYGWHKPDGKPIQPLYTGHADTWVDYSHGIRLVSRRVLVDDEPTTIDAVLADPKRAPLLSNEGVIHHTRYPRATSVPSLKAAPGTKLDVMHFDAGVRVVIDRPVAPSDKSMLLILYALPNGNTIEQTIGKAIEPGDDWHFDIQHIGAQLAFLREKITDRQLVVAYLENSQKSWPAWRRTHGDARIPEIVAAVQKRCDAAEARIVLSGHSGGGSFVFGYLNSVATIPDQIERIAFLDANYAYETGRHLEKLTRWLKASDAHYLVVLAYNDAVALLNGKSFVSASGGTWGRSRQMLDDLASAMPFTKQTSGDLQHCAALVGRVRFLLRENPERKVLHTVQVEKNGFIESLLSGTKLDRAGYTYLGDRAYERYILRD